MVAADSHWVAPHELVNVPVHGLDPFPGDHWIHDVGLDGMRVVESRISDAIELNCSRVAVVGEEPDGRWIQGGESLWRIGSPKADQVEMRDAGLRAAADLASYVAEVDEKHDNGWIRCP